MRHDLESGAWIEITPLQDLKGKDRDRFDKVIRFALPLTEAGDLDAIRTVAERLDMREVRRDAAMACFITAWSFETAPGEPLPELALAEFYSFHRMDAKVFEIVKRVRPTTARLPANEAAEVEAELSVLEAKAWMSQTNVANARRVLQSLLDQHPGDLATAELVFKAYLTFGDPTNALQLVVGKLATEPDNIAALNNQAAILIQMNRAAEAITVLNHALSLTNTPAIRLNRAIAYLQSSNLPAAEAEYLDLANQSADVFSVHYGLASIAGQRHDTNLASQQLAICLSNAPPGTVKWERARAQLEALKDPAGQNPAGKPRLTP